MTLAIAERSTSGRPLHLRDDARGQGRKARERRGAEQDLRRRVEASETGLVAFHFHVSEDGTEVSNVQVHVDAASMDAYLPLVQDKIAQALALTETTSIDVYGTPGPVVQQVLRLNEEQGVRVGVKPHHVGGFTRSAVA